MALAHAPRTLALEPAAQSVKSIPESRFTYPPTRRLELKDTIFGVEVEDPYRWLEDGAAPDVLAWMKAQDEFARAQLRKLPGRAAMAARLKELYFIDSIGVPMRRGERDFYTRRYAGKEKSVGSPDSQSPIASHDQVPARRNATAGRPHLDGNAPFAARSASSKAPIHQARQPQRPDIGER